MELAETKMHLLRMFALFLALLSAVAAEGDHHHGHGHNDHGHNDHGHNNHGHNDAAGQDDDDEYYDDYDDEEEDGTGEGAELELPEPEMCVKRE